MGWLALLNWRYKYRYAEAFSSDNITKQYRSILEAFGCYQHVTKPTRIMCTSKMLIDHIVTNNRSCVTATDVIPGRSISDHEGIFACVNVHVPRYQPRYKWIRWEKNLNVNEFVNDCACLPLSVIYGLDSPDDMVHGFNTLFGECIERHAPLKRMKVTRPAAPWMNSDQIRKLQVERENWVVKLMKRTLMTLGMRSERCVTELNR